MNHTIRHVICTLISLLLLAASIRYLTDFWVLAFVYSFQLHIAFAGFLASGAVFLLSRSRWPAVLMLWSLVLFGHGLIMEREFSLSGELAAGSQPLKVVSFNLLQENHRNRRPIANMIIESQADVVFVMEGQPLIPLLDELQKTYPWRLGCGVGTSFCDMMIFSRHPMSDAKFHTLSDLRRERFATAVVDWSGKKINLAAIHLPKPYFDHYHDYELTQATYILQGLQGPLIVAGDFNSSGIAPDMQRFMRRNNLFAADRREPATWPIRAGYFGIPIDHIFTRSPGFITKLSRLEDNYGSNHFGLTAEIAIPD